MAEPSFYDIARSFLEDLAKEINSAFSKSDPEGVAVIVEGLATVISMIERDRKVMSAMAACLSSSIVEDSFNEDNAITLLKIWKEIQ